MIYDVSIRNTRNTYVEGIVADGDRLLYFNVDGTHKRVWCDHGVSRIALVRQGLLEVIQMRQSVVAPLAVPTENHEYYNDGGATSHVVLVLV